MAYGDESGSGRERTGRRRRTMPDFDVDDENLDWDVRRSRTYDPYWQYRRRSSAYGNYGRPFGQSDYDEYDPDRDYYSRGEFSDWEYERKPYTRNFGFERQQMPGRSRRRDREFEQDLRQAWENDPEEEENREYGYDRSYSRGFYGFNREPYRSSAGFEERYWGEQERGAEETSDYVSYAYEEPDYYEEWWAVPGPYEGVGPRGYQRSDERIFEDVCERITQHGRIDARDVDVHVENGVVTLSGEVDDRRTKRLMEDTIENVPGLADIHNELRVRGKKQE